ncbi:MAG: hypothetical protein CMF31_05105 [Kordiimonas sp.]|nr:hypothetical protein [Kordiimonas sp.]|tara:strand:- start:850 stop:1095 length:246 start_codon:yes stop_codon:yes gene_type:complete
MSRSINETAISILRADYERLLARKEKAIAKIEDNGELVGGANGFPIENPWLAVERTASAELLKVIKELEKRGVRPWQKSGR